MAAMEIESKVLAVLEDVLELGGRSRQWTRDTPLLGAVPELDSMAVVILITALAERFDVVIDEDDIDGSVFASVGWGGGGGLGELATPPQ
ncbi:MAG: hypothetical protein ACOVPA_04070, partial [Rubrivivax sp.]